MSIKSGFPNYLILLALALLMPISDLFAQAKPADADVSFHVSKTQKCSKYRQTDLGIDKLKGAVKKTVTEIYSLLRPDDITATPELSTISTIDYNQKGMWANRKGEYKGNKISNPNGGGMICQRLFDTNGNISIETTTNTDSTSYNMIRYEYSNNGKPVLAKTHYFEKGDAGVEEKEGLKKYDEWGNCTEDVYSLTKFLYKYDEFGNCIESRWITCYPYQMDSTRDTTITKTIFDENCRAVEVNAISRSTVIGRSVSKTTNKYDGQGRLSESKYQDFTDAYTGITLYKYDDKGNEVYRDDSVTGRVVITYSYRYDNHGNWLEALQYENGRLYTRQKRKIMYY